MRGKLSRFFLSSSSYRLCHQPQLGLELRRTHHTTPRANAPSQLSRPHGSGQRLPARRRCEGAHPPSQLSRLPIWCPPGRSAARLPVLLVTRHRFVSIHVHTQLHVYSTFRDYTSKASVQRLAFHSYTFVDGAAVKADKNIQTTQYLW